jgi:hypothetical protein
MLVYPLKIDIEVEWHSGKTNPNCVPCYRAFWLAPPLIPPTLSIKHFNDTRDLLATGIGRAD